LSTIYTKIDTLAEKLAALRTSQIKMMKDEK
jgi:hypothetical protein